MLFEILSNLRKLLPIGLPTQRCNNMHTMLNQVVLSTLKQCWYFYVAFVCKILACGDVTVNTTLSPFLESVTETNLRPSLF